MKEWFAGSAMAREVSFSDTSSLPTENCERTSREFTSVLDWIATISREVRPLPMRDSLKVSGLSWGLPIRFLQCLSANASALKPADEIPHLARVPSFITGSEGHHGGGDSTSPCLQHPYCPFHCLLLQFLHVTNFKRTPFIYIIRFVYRFYDRHECFRGENCSFWAFFCFRCLLDCTVVFSDY